MKNAKEIMECVTNPVKSRIILAVNSKGCATAQELKQLLPDIPQATLYRNINRLFENEILTVVSENKVRGIIEKNYAVNEQLFAQNPIVNENDGMAYYKLFTNFILELMNAFKEYAEKPAINIAEDGSGFSASAIFASVKDMEEIGVKIKEIIAPYQTVNSENKEKQWHTIATIITPPKE